MRVKLIQAASMAEAMRRVRAELGDDALILGNRRVPGGVEITAALEPETVDPPAPQARSPAQAAPPSLTPEVLRQQQMTDRAAALSYGTLDWSKPVMLVGTPGAGKTLTAAKLATRLVRGGENPMIITTDSERAGATEQLAAFTRILELKLILADNPLVMSRALATRPNGRKAIIDMAGLNPFDPAQRETLLTFAITADASLVWVLPAGLDPEDAAEMGEVFACLGVRQIIPTKLDLTQRMEGILRAAEAGSFTLTDAGMGAGVVDGLIDLDAEYLIGKINPLATRLKARQAA